MTTVLHDNQEPLRKFVLLDYRTLSLVDAHHALGAHVRTQVHKILARRLGELSNEALHTLLWQARDCRETLERRSADPDLPVPVRRAISEYLACVQSWAAGAGIDEFEHPHLAGISTLERVLLLQHDESGCQTGLYRSADGSVILWHTEEDVEAVPGDRFDTLRLAAFRVEEESGPVDIQAFIYPDLLPGSAFAWRSDGYTQAIDTLHTRAFQQSIGGLLANCLCWLTLRLGPTVELSDLLTQLQPYYTGYAINVMFRHEGKVTSHQFEFAGSYLTHTELPNQPGSYLFQANIFCDPRGDAARVMELTPIEKWRNYRRRVYRTRRFLAKKQKGQSPQVDMAFLYKMMSTHAGGKWAYANQDVKAHMLHRLSADETETWLGAGPAVQHNQNLLVL